MSLRFKGAVSNFLCFIIEKMILFSLIYRLLSIYAKLILSHKLIFNPLKCIEADLLIVKAVKAHSVSL